MAGTVLVLNATYEPLNVTSVWRACSLILSRKAEVLEADAWDAFTEAGSAFDPVVAARLKACIYSRGDSVEPGAAFRAFRGRDARIEPMLRGRGLIA